jgi:Flp pilus assembly protein TadD
VRLVKNATVTAAIGAALVLAAGPLLAGDPAKNEASDQMKWGFQAAKRGYWLEALDRFERANGLTPNQPRILNNIAVALEASGRFQDALAAYESALAVAPNDKVLRRNFSRFKEFYDAQVAIKQPDSTDDEATAAGQAASQDAATEDDDA